MKKPINLHAERHAKFKALGLLGGHQKKNENYSAAERKKLYRLDKAFGHLADIHLKPKKHRRGKENTASAVKVKTAKEARILREKGYKVYKDKVVIRHATNQSVKITRRGTTALLTETKLTSGRVIPATELLITKKESYLLVQSGKLDNLPHGTFVTGHFGDNAAFKRRFPDAKALQKYLNAFVPKDTQGLNKRQIQELKQELIGGLGFVVIKDR